MDSIIIRKRFTGQKYLVNHLIDVISRISRKVWDNRILYERFDINLSICQTPICSQFGIVVDFSLSKLPRLKAVGGVPGLLGDFIRVKVSERKSPFALIHKPGNICPIQLSVGGD